jgi:hypothetical protein
MIENMWLRGIFGHVRKEVTGGRRKLCNEEFQELNCSPAIFGISKSRKDGRGM